MDVVSFETAVKLKESGFPQPDVIRGQVWYSSNGNSFIVYAVNDGHYDIISETGTQWVGRYKQDSEMVFAPTATDMLRELDFEFNLWFSPEKRAYFISKDIGYFCGPENVASHTNPSEAAALAYLSKQLKEN